MNLGIISGSLAVETACPNRDQDFLFRHSLSSTALATEDKNARVTARPPTRANQPRHHGTTAYTPNVGRNIGLRCHRFHVVPFLFVATNSRKPKSPDAHKETSFVVFFSGTDSFVYAVHSVHRSSHLFRRRSLPAQIFHRTVPHCSA